MDSFARSLGTFVLFPDPLPQGLRHVRGFPALGLLTNGVSRLQTNKR
jgi:hypothetical protein